MKIGFIGLGVMGSRMAKRIHNAGYNLKVFDVMEDAVMEFEKLGVEVGSSPGDVAIDTDVILMSLPNSQIVTNVILGEDGILSKAKPGTILVDLSSITPKAIRDIYKKTSQKGVEILDAPVSGGSAGAESGNLTIMVGGKKEILHEVMPILETMGKTIYHVGDVGAGDTVKLVNNLLLGANMVAVAEALTLGVKAGLDPEVMFEVITNSSGNSYALKAKYPKFISQGNFEPGFMIDLQYKDLQLAVDTAKDLNLPLVMGNMAQQIYEMAKAEGLGQKDISSVVKLYEKWSGITVRKEE
ncbi:2-(hydroxymethyl)glutarate dehydrogenase [Tepidanaerobacter acetatoxydans Re1]|uniref:2-(Hydroxymethyl)glutarate dehydrogenase n=1 Tax=Tepidanaerobacter acetatoxydans (strain DSM 21804 / JCM 16047 / Re1) TaxID=1209989 RepID=F4LUN1_TEPAE|nr:MULTISPECIES: NAD(P)-dependent oxidoreductase [Tepidanaerobacter]AEE90599.1 3-hydroxyisobutyrate dehydrogenase [Tepidanaerobacter acetatoxydans Re1]CDI40376.1 2-(hydroxymethyl)glutarate dehydrogenase [Tepidanaerobacter acetatoxydans Re1]